jgi:hypothetical protein
MGHMSTHGLHDLISRNRLAFGPHEALAGSGTEDHHR